MRKTWKRVVAVLCAAVLIAGAPLTGRSWTVKADTGTEKKEWSIISADTKVPASGIYQRTDLSLNLNKTDADRADLVMYMRVTLASEEAVTTMKGSYVELSQVTCDDAEIQWTLKNLSVGEKLSVGENVICLKFSQGSPQGSTPINLSQEIKHFRIFNVEETQVSGWADVTLKEVKVAYLAPVVRAYTDGATAGTAPADTPDGYAFAGWYTDETCTTVLSGTATGTAYAKFVNKDVMSVKAQYKLQYEEEDLSGQMVANCDSVEDFSEVVGSVTTEEEEVKEGTGAVKLVGTDQFRYRMVFPAGKEIDIAGYKFLHLWFYVDNVASLNGNLRIGIGSGGTHDDAEIKWSVSKEQLTDGWNELKLDFADASTSDSFQYKKINYMRIYQNSGVASSSIVTIVDDVRAVNEVEGKFILDCDTKDSRSGISGADITTVEGEYKEGSGAAKSTSGQIRLQSKLKEAVDISEYADGKLHLWLYVGDKSSLTSSSLHIEISSSGQADNNELQWNVSLSSLNGNSWNELNLELSEGIKNGTIDLSAVNFVRMYFDADETVDFIVDDIRAISADPEITAADVRFVSTVDTLDYSKIGFDFEITSGRERSFESNIVYTALKGMEDDGTVLVYPPITVAPQSNYFFTYALRNIPSSDFDVAITATPYWITRDGTKVNGISRTLTVNELLNAAASQN